MVKKRVEKVGLRKRTLRDYKIGGEAYLDIVIALRDANVPVVVSKEEMTKAAAICGSCKENRKNAPQRGLLERLTDNKIAKLLVKLGVHKKAETACVTKGAGFCNVCTCNCALNIAVHGRFLTKKNNKYKFPSNCWIPKRVAEIKEQSKI